MPPSRRVLAAISTAALLGAGATAASASAAVVAVAQKCVVTADNDPAPMTIVGSGFVPGGTVAISTRSKQHPTPVTLTTALVAASGSFVTPAPAAPYNSEATLEQKFDLFAAEGPVGAATSFTQVRLSYQRVPSKSRPGKRVKHIARGFTPGKVIWAHFRHAGITRATKRLGVAQGPCGKVTKKMRALPAKSRLGLWKVYVDETKTFSTADRPQARLDFNVIRKIF